MTRRERILEATKRQIPLAYIPVEIMSNIFKLVQGDHEVRRNRNTDGHPWFFVTHVCKSWRDIAIRDKCLWTYIHSTAHANLHQTKTYLERSGSANLLVRYFSNSSGNGAMERLQETFHHLSRIRELYILCSGQIIPAGVLTGLQKPAPALQKFSIAGNLDRNVDLSTLFSGIAPNLRDFSLLSLGLSISWKRVPYLQFLRHLHICFYFGGLDLRQFLHILAANPGLESLDIYRVEEGDSAMEDNSVLIELPRLKSFGIGATHDVLERLIHRIRIPTNIQFKIICGSFTIADSSSCVRSFTENRDDHCKTLDIYVEQMSLDIRSCSYTSAEDNKRPIHNSIQYHFQESFIPDGPSTALRFICNMIKTGFYNTATELNIVIDDDDFPDLSQPVGPSTWIRLFELLPCLQKISFTAHAGFSDGSSMEEYHRSLLDALICVRVDNEGRTKGLICPNLSELCLNEYAFLNGIQSLLGCLCARAQNGSRLRRFEVNQPYGITDSLLKKLEESNIADDIVISLENDDDYLLSDSET